MLLLDANGLRFAALTWGEGPPVLLLHGFPDTAHTWDAIGPRIAAAGFRVIAPFMRGYAPTSAPGGDAPPKLLGRDALGILDALAAEKAVVVGHDWGAEAAYAAVALAPQRIERLVTIGIPPRAAIRPTPQLAWSLRHFAAFKLPGAAGRFAANDFAAIETLWKRWSPTWRYQPVELEPVRAALSPAGCLDTALGYYRGTPLVTPAFLRAPIRVPTLSIAGADDPGVSPDVYEQARPHFTAGYRVAAIPGGHFCHRESPEALLSAVLPFLLDRPP